MTKRPEFHITPSAQAPVCVCPYCGSRIDAMFGVTGTASPAPGDASVCAYCAGLLVFALDLTVREPDEAELAEMVKSPHLLIAQIAAHAVIQRRRKP